MERITPQEAIARLQSQGKKKSKGVKVLDVLDTIGVAEDDIYILGNADGGILAPAFRGMPILGTWKNGGEMPPALRMWLQGYAEELEWMERVGERLPAPTESPTKAPAKPRQSVSAMLETKWSQKAPYNDMCIFEGKRCVTGCNATAAAQIIYYWREFHRGCKATDAYVTSTNQYAVDALPAIVTFDYKNLVANPKTADEKKAVAQLMAYLGRTMHSNYTPSATGAYTHKLANHLRDVFKMGDATAIWASKLGESGFEQKVYQEILSHRPVILGGDMVSGGGHAFVVDGYDANTDIYHVNWGWGGSYNGWFKMSALNATSQYAFNSNKVAVIGIQPNKLGDINGDGEVDIADAMQVIQDINHGTTKNHEDINNDGQVTITDAMLIIDKILGKIDL